MSDTSNNSSAQYDENSIVALKPMEHVRLRPKTYIGGTDSQAMHWLIQDIIRELLALVDTSKISRISVILEDSHRVTISDNGIGIPDENCYGQKLIEIIFGSIGQRQVPVAVANGLSSHFEVTTKCDGWVRNQRFQRGVPDAPETKIREMTDGESTGTSITFVPDFEIFEAGDFSFWTFAQILREQAYLTKGVKITLEDKRPAFEHQRMSFCFPEGLKTYLEHLDEGTWHFGVKPITHNIVFSENLEIEGRRFHWAERQSFLEVGIKFLSNKALLSAHIFLNNVKAHDMGVETEAFTAAVHAFFVKYWGILSSELEEKPTRKPRITKQKVTRGVVVVFNVQHPDVYFHSPYSAILLNRVFYPIIYEATTRQLTAMLDTHRDILEHIAQRL